MFNIELGIEFCVVYCSLPDTELKFDILPTICHCSTVHVY